MKVLTHRIRSRWLFALALALALAGLPVWAQGTEPSNPKLAPVLALYRDFSWQATISEPSTAGTELLRQPKEVLVRYFDERLTALLLRERACIKAFGLCALDFSPLWDSQDPLGTTIRVSNELGTDDITVRLYHPGRPEATRLIFRVSSSKSGYRIQTCASRTRRAPHWSNCWSLRPAASHQLEVAVADIPIAPGSLES